jgi:hypothetical protein
LNTRRETPLAAALYVAGEVIVIVSTAVAVAAMSLVGYVMETGAATLRARSSRRAATRPSP